MKRSRRIILLVSYVFLIISSFIMIYPVLFMALGSFTTRNRFLEASIGRRASVDGNENPVVHDNSFGQARRTASRASTAWADARPEWQYRRPKESAVDADQLQGGHVVGRLQ